MGCEVIRVNGDTWRIEEGGVRFFLLAGKDKALLIDSGMETRDARDIAQGLTDLPLELLNTHADRDHIGSNAQFASFYMHPAEEPNYRKGGNGGTIVPVSDGDELDLGGRELRIVHLPGHTPGSVAVLDVNRRVLISGDPVQKNGRVFMFGEHRNMADYVKSLEKLENMAGSFDEIWPSHGDIPVPPSVIPAILNGARDVLAGKARGKKAELFGNVIVAYDVGVCTLLCGE